jgi:putative lipoprotein
LDKEIKMSNDTVINISGNVYYLERIALLPNSTLYVSLLDVTVSGVPGKLLDQQVTPDADMAGLKFTLSYRASDAVPGRQYAISAQIKNDDKLIFVTAKRHSVILDGTSLPPQKVLVRAGNGNGSVRNPDRP